MRIRWKTLIAGASITAAGVAAIVTGIQLGGPATAIAAKTMERPPRRVRVLEIRGEGASSEQSYTGVIRARYETDLSFRVAGKVISRHVELGERVKAGQPLFRLDPEDYDLAIKAAESDLIAAEAEVKVTAIEHDRAMRLRRSGAVSPSEFDRTLSERDMAAGKRDRADRMLGIARNRFSYCTLMADAEGVITALPAEAGQVVAEGQPVARLAREGMLEAVVNLPENRVVATRSAIARVTLWSNPDDSIPAKLRELSPAADPVTRTYQARFTIPSAGRDVELGMTATVHLALNDDAPGFVLPLSSLLRRDERPSVWVVKREAGPPILTPVDVREYRQESVVVTSGVKAGDLVVTGGVQKLDSKASVLPWEAPR